MPVKITNEVRQLTTLKADPKNARRHSEQQIADIAGAIEEFGYVNLIAVRPNGQIIGGHATCQALERLHRAEAECRVIAGLSERQYQRLALALNKLPENSSWDNGILAEILGDLPEDERDGIGFSTSELDKLLAEDEQLEVREVATGDVADEFWISVRGPLKHQAQALRALEEAVGKLEGVSVDLGTISVEA